MLAALVSFLFLSAHLLQAQAPEAPPNLPSCGPEFENPADAYGYDVITRADQMIQAKDQNGAMTLLTENFDRFTRVRAILFSKMLGIYLAQDNIKDARSFYLQSAKLSPELARAGIDQIYSYYLQKGDDSAVIEWTEQLTTLSLPDDLSAQVFAWHLQAVCARGATDEARAVVKKSIGKFNAETCRPIFSPAIASLIKSEKYADAARLLEMIEKACPPAQARPGSSAGESSGAGELRSMVLAERARIAFLQNRWNDGESLIIKKASDLSDDDLAEIISFSAAKAQKKEEFEAVDRICIFVLKNQKDKNKAKNEAAACSLTILKKNNKVAEIPARFEQFIEAGLPIPNLYDLYCECFHSVILLENKDLSLRMMAIGEKFKAKLDNPDDKKQLALLLMDGLFTIGDYERSLQIIDANEKYWQKDWMDSTKSKIGAHLALQNKNYKEAIDGFRKYMDYVANNNETARHPVTDQIYTKEMLLGFNALRIGDILRDNLKDEDGARKAYDEAEQYFKKATDEVKPNSKESKYIDEQMTQLASRKKK